MASVSLVASLALLVYMGIVLSVGRARLRYEVEAPAVTGNPIFERHFRVQQNTVEQLVLFFPALFLFAQLVSEGLAALLGLVFVAGRVIYAIGYVKDPARRGPGFLISSLANTALVLGALAGSVRALLAG
jgi:uncharacterized membrane protein YecN with MAPEG domain